MQNIIFIAMYVEYCMKKPHLIMFHDMVIREFKLNIP